MMITENKTFASLLGCILFASIFFAGCIDQQDLQICEFPENLDAYDMVWSDEFDGTEIDDTKWDFDLGDGCDVLPNGERCGWGNNELQWYTSRPENVFVSDGKLVIRAQKEVPQYFGKNYTSARIVSKNKGDWRYGRIDVRAKIPRGQGLWSAIWMLPTDTLYGKWPKSGEIDIMENIGDQLNKVLSTIHFGHDRSGANSRFYTGEYIDESAPISQDFHVFSLLWKENCMEFYVDGQPVTDFIFYETGEIVAEKSITPSTTLPSTWPFQERFHLIMNIAVGGNLPGDPDGTTVFPKQMEVDYVRVYQER